MNEDFNSQFHRAPNWQEERFKIGVGIIVVFIIVAAIWGSLS